MSRTWTLRYRAEGGRRRWRLGSLSLAKARRAAQAILGQIAAGKDPQEGRAGARLRARGRRAAGTVADLVERLIRVREADLAENTVRSWRGILKNHVRPSVLGHMEPSEVARRDVRRLLDDMAPQTPVASNRALELLRVAFGWAVDREILATSPCVGLHKTPERGRDRVLSHDELRRVLLALDVEETGEPSEMLERLCGRAAEGADEPEAAAQDVGRAGAAELAVPPRPIEAAAWRLLLLTGLRATEVLAAPWGEVDLSARRWTIPAERMKAGRRHVVPLSTAAVAVLTRLRDLAGESPFVLQSPRNPARHLRTLQHSLARLHSLSQTEGWSAHDIRHTLRSELSALGIGFEAKELILAHALPGLAGRYDHHSFLPERAAALETWAAVLDRVRTRGDEAEAGAAGVVVPFRR